MSTLPPGMISTQIGRDFDAEAAMEVGGDRLAQRRDAGRRRVAVLAVAQRLDRRLDDMGRGFEIGLADAEVDDVAPLPLQLGGAGEHRESVLIAEARKGGNDIEHGRPPSKLARSRPADPYATREGSRVPSPRLRES